MSAAPKMKRSGDRWAGVLYSLENLHEDLQVHLVNPWIRTFDQSVALFIYVLKEIKQEKKA
jgi:hypothetical protein